MRTLAIDLGTKRIGMAMSDEGGRFATPLDVLQVSSAQLALDPILKLIAREGVQRIVIGLPLNMDGSVGAQAKSVIDWTVALTSKMDEIKGTAPFTSSAIVSPIVFVDERLSSFDAEQRLIDRKRGGEKITRKSKKQMLDALVAAALLQAFLDGKLPALDLSI